MESSPPENPADGGRLGDAAAYGSREPQAYCRKITKRCKSTVLPKTIFNFLSFCQKHQVTVFLKTVVLRANTPVFVSYARTS